MQNALQDIVTKISNLLAPRDKYSVSLYFLKIVFCMQEYQSYKETISYYNFQSLLKSIENYSTGRNKCSTTFINFGNYPGAPSVYIFKAGLCLSSFSKAKYKDWGTFTCSKP